MAAVASTPPATAAMAQSRSGSRSSEAVTADKRRRGRACADIDFQVGPRVTHATLCAMYQREPEDPVYRPLQIYALEPSASVLNGAIATVNVPYEPIERGERGPRGAILEIDDVSARSEDARSVDLDHPFVLMKQGHMPSPEDPLFRQQMLYAVCTTTYAAFRHALGRDIAWGFRRSSADSSDASRLRIRPGIENLQNAFYNRTRGELCFGTFAAGGSVVGRNVPGGQISLALSHDVVVHEMSHALLDGLRSHFLYPSNVDVLAFHEALADLVAIFQRFTYRDVVQAAIRESRGDLSCAALLTKIAVQFAEAMNSTGSLRSAIAGTDRTYEDTIEPHHRGELLVSAVFEAFSTVYERKTKALRRLATDGTGVLPEGQISDVLASQLTHEASKLASQFLSICIRAIDYCPPIDITFGEFLRAVITADQDLVPHDEFAYREAWIDAFAKRRMYPEGVKSLSMSSLPWCGPEGPLPPEPELSFGKLEFKEDPGRPASEREIKRRAVAFGQLAADPEYLSEFGLARSGDPELDGDKVSLPIVESVRSSRRVGPSGQVVFDLVAEITQRRAVKARDGHAGFDFYGGATAILDPKGKLRYVIRKSVLNNERLRRQANYLTGNGRQFFGAGPGNALYPEPKLLLHVHDVTRPQLHKAGATRSVLGDVSKPGALTPDRYLLRVGNTDVSVRLLKKCLNTCMKLENPALEDSPVFDDKTERAVSRFQSRMGAAVDGIVGPATWTLISSERRKAESNVLDIDKDVPLWIARLLTNDPQAGRPSGIEMQDALDLYRFIYGPLSPQQAKGLSFLLQSLLDDAALATEAGPVWLNWAAYMLATVKHECANTWEPIEEYGRGANRAYGEEVEVRDSLGHIHTNRYYGRGYVQLTWKDNYESLGHAIDMGDELMIHPELALQKDIAYRVMSHGMRGGVFTGRNLARYLSKTGIDYENARRIINGTDRAAGIAGYAIRMETVLLASARFTSS